MHWRYTIAACICVCMFKFRGGRGGGGGGGGEVQGFGLKSRDFGQPVQGSSHCRLASVQLM